jgi:hypothetical protein
MAVNYVTKTVDTIAELKALKGVVNTAARVNVLGGVAAGDGKGGLFFWADTSTRVADDIDCVQVSGVTTGRYIRIQSNGASFSDEDFDL